jgi:hypothetical protein
MKLTILMVFIQIQCIGVSGSGAPVWKAAPIVPPLQIKPCRRLVGEDALVIANGGSSYQLDKKSKTDTTDFLVQ